MNSVKRRIASMASSPSKDPFPPENSYDDLSPELVPIVTLLSSQSHRRYYEGIFMLYYDLNGDGKPADREWKEVYGILTGNQLAYWDAANLAEFKHNPAALLETSSKPNYINFTDSVYNAMKTLPAAKQNLDNIIIVSTTLKNRYIIQFKSTNDLNNWYTALRLSNFEYQSLQSAYTGALLSARGSRLSDIKTILAEKRFDHEDWVSIRYGSGMAWKRCYAVIEPSTTKRKSFIPGRILFFENDQKKKKGLMAVVTNATMVSAIYPQSHLLIDHSTMLKLEGYINFKSPSLSTKVSKKSVDDFKNTAIFLMPEQHSAVPGFDTLIRFLIPLLDSFGLYGRPKRLKAERNDTESLLFGLPTLPHVHYLELEHLKQFASDPGFLNWDVTTWNANLKNVLKGKIGQGYEGCGSSRGLAGAISSLNSPLSPSLRDSERRISSEPNKNRPQLPGYPQQPHTPQSANFAKPMSSSPLLLSPYRSVSNSTVAYRPNAQGPESNGTMAAGVGAAGALATGALAVNNGGEYDPHKSIQLADIYQKYSDIKSPSDQFHTDRNGILNGSFELLVEDNLPAEVRKINLSENVYPKDDNELFSEDDDEEDDDSDKIDARQIGLLHNGSGSKANLFVPPYDNRNSSYSSVQSPMTQYQEFNEKFSQVVEKSKFQPYPLDISSDPDSPPAVPPHDEKFSGERINHVASGSISNTSHEQTSIHSQMANVSSTSPYSNYSPEKVASSRRLNSQPRPKYITSPNSSQNNVPAFLYDDYDQVSGSQVKNEKPPQQAQPPSQYSNSVPHHIHSPISQQFPHKQTYVQQPLPPPPQNQQQRAPSPQKSSHPYAQAAPPGKPQYVQVPPKQYTQVPPPQQSPTYGGQPQQQPVSGQGRPAYSPQAQNYPSVHHAHRKPPGPAQQYHQQRPPQNSGIPPSVSYTSRPQGQPQPMGQPMGQPTGQRPPQQQPRPQQTQVYPQNMQQQQQDRQQYPNMRNYNADSSQRQYQYQAQYQAPPNAQQPPPTNQEQQYGSNKTRYY